MVEPVRVLKGTATVLGLLGGAKGISSEIRELAELVGPRFFRLTLRGIERAMSYISLALHSCDEDSAERLKPFVVIAAVVRVGNETAFKRLQRDGSVVAGEGPSAFFGWAKQRFEGAREDKAVNVFVVPELQEAAMLLGMYEIPGPEEEQSPSGGLDMA